MVGETDGSKKIYGKSRVYGEEGPRWGREVQTLSTGKIHESFINNNGIVL